VAEAKEAWERLRELKVGATQGFIEGLPKEVEKHLVHPFLEQDFVLGFPLLIEYAMLDVGVEGLQIGDEGTSVSNLDEMIVMAGEEEEEDFQQAFEAALK